MKKMLLKKTHRTPETKKKKNTYTHTYTHTTKKKQKTCLKGNCFTIVVAWRLRNGDFVKSNELRLCSVWRPSPTPRSQKCLNRKRVDLELFLSSLSLSLSFVCLLLLFRTWQAQQSTTLTRVSEPESLLNEKRRKRTGQPKKNSLKKSKKKKKKKE
jgi:hypothetical protein